MENERTERRAPSGSAKFVILAAVILVLALLVIALVLSLGKDGASQLTKEEILAVVESGSSPDKPLFVADYLEYWKFPEFDLSVLSVIETRYTAFYYKDLPEQAPLAKDTAKLFIEHFWDEIDHSDKDTVTSALAACYINAIGDKYGAYRPPTNADSFSTDMSGEHVGVGISVINDPDAGGIRIIEVMPSSPALEAGMKSGDIVISVGNTGFSDVSYDEFVSLIRGEAGTEVTLGVLRDGTPLEFTMPRRLVVHETVTSKMLDGNIGYIKISEFKRNTPILFKNALDDILSQGARGVIFDLSTNPGGYLVSVCEMLSLLVPTGTPIASFSNSSAPVFATHGTELEEEDRVLSIPSVVIATENTASAGELFAAALADYNDMGHLDSLVVGRTTYKKGVMQSTYLLSLDSTATITLTTAYYMPPSGVCYDGIGVIPDVTVNKDSSLEASAISELNKLIESINKPAA